MVVDSEVVRLVQVTLRTFYDNKFAVVMDQLVRKEASVRCGRRSQSWPC